MTGREREREGEREEGGREREKREGEKESAATHQRIEWECFHVRAAIDDAPTPLLRKTS
jgi:hypothetical protein